jgi:hypothetical protein
MAPVPVDGGGSGFAGVDTWGCPPGLGGGAVTAGGAPTAGAVDGAVPPDVPGPVPPMTPPTDPNGEWMGQNAFGSVPGMNDSM